MDLREKEVLDLDTIKLLLDGLKYREEQSYKAKKKRWFDMWRWVANQRRAWYGKVITEHCSEGYRVTPPTEIKHTFHVETQKEIDVLLTWEFWFYLQGHNRFTIDL
jgi:hypothetical protein